MSRANPVDRLPWDAKGLDLRFQSHMPDVSAEDRATLVKACLDMPAMGVPVPEAFAQIKLSLQSRQKRR